MPTHGSPLKPAPRSHRITSMVIAYEPVPVFRAFFVYNIHLNDLASLIDVQTSVVGAVLDVYLDVSCDVFVMCLGVFCSHPSGPFPLTPVCTARPTTTT